MRVIVTGQVGIDKKSYLESVAALGADAGHEIHLYHVGDRMYREASDLAPGRILDLPLSRLHALRRSVFKDILRESADQEHVVVNTHATFRWRHGLFRAFDFDQIEQFQPDLFLCMVDNAECVHYRLQAEHTLDTTLKDMMVWREEEIMATELLARAMGVGNQFYVMSRGRDAVTTQSALRLIVTPHMRKVYPSFPMSHVVDMPDVLAEIDAFREELGKRFIAFDPGDVDEKLLLERAFAAMKEGLDFIEGGMLTDEGEWITFPVSVKQTLDCARDIDGQIYSRDFLLIRQSDMICSYVPELPGGLPGLSSGVERELQHAFEHGKEVYVVWRPARTPSPFITETATKVFGSVDEALAHFAAEGMVPA
jgi:adenylate kinase